MRALAALHAPCVLHQRHAPKPHILDDHHVVPKSWVGGPGEAGPTISVCDTGHSNVHSLIDAMVAAGVAGNYIVGSTVLRQYTTQEVYWAQQAISRAVAMGAIPRRTL